jgi:hypothetical protein
MNKVTPPDPVAALISPAAAGPASGVVSICSVTSKETL